MRLNPDQNLSAEALEVIYALTATIPNSIAIPEVDMATLSRFVCGWLPSDVQENVITKLGDSHDLREQFVATKRKLDYLNQLPWETAVTDEEIPELTACLREMMRTSLKTYSASEQWGENGNWSAARTPQNDEARAIKSALAAVGEAIRRSLSRPRIAYARGSEDQPLLPTSLTSDIQVTFSVTHDDSGTLSARMRLIELHDGAADSLEGQTFALELIEGPVVLGSARIENKTWSVDIRGIGDLLSLEPGPQRASLFRLRPETDLASVDDPQIIDATVSGNVRKSSDRNTVPIELIERPKVENGKLVLRIAVASRWTREYSEYVLRLFVRVGDKYQLIGDWPLQRWNDGPQTLNVHLAGIDDNLPGKFYCQSILRAQLVMG